MTVFRPVMHVCLAEGYALRWRGGDAVAYVFADREDRDSDRTLGAIDTISVPATGWTDVVEVRAVAARWRRGRSRVA